MKARLNLATKPVESHRRFLVGTGFSAFIAAIVFLVLGWHVYSVRKAAAELRRRDQEIRREFAKYDAQGKDLEAFFAKKDVASLNGRAEFINGIIAVRSFNWTKMFMDLERILPGGVRVISIEPKQVSGHVEVSLTAGATSDEVMYNFLHTLETSKVFSEVQLKGVHQPTAGNASSGDQRVFQLSAFYSGT